MSSAAYQRGYDKGVASVRKLGSALAALAEAAGYKGAFDRAADQLDREVTIDTAYLEHTQAEGADTARLNLTYRGLIGTDQRYS